MSCELRTLAPLEDFEKCRQFLCSESAGNDNWLQECTTAVSPAGDRIVLAHGSALVVLSTRWVRGDDNETSPRLSVTCQWDAAQNLPKTDEITSLVCLPLVATGHASQGGPDWTCIAVGFSSGYVRFFTEKMDLLAAECLHAEPLLQIKAASYRKGRQIGVDGGENVFAVYSSVICSLSGFSLFQTLRGCRGQVALSHSKGGQKLPDVSLDYKKYSMSSLPSAHQTVTDACLINCGSVNNFDHLLTATLSEGFYCNYRPSPPQNSLVATTGDGPWLKFQYTRDGVVAPLELTDVAVTVISKIPGWLGWGSNKAAENKERPAEKLQHRFSLTDKRRIGRSLIVSPDGSLFAVTDVLGRVTLVEARTGVAIRMWKGYRDADCAFIEAEDEPPKTRHRRHSSSSSQTQHRALFLVIYAPKKSLLEIFSLRHGPLVAALKINKSGKLIYTPHGLMGFNTPPHKGSNASCYPAAFMSEHELMEITVPFHCALTDSSSAPAKDMHLVKQLCSLLKSEEFDSEKQIEEVKKVALKLNTDEGRFHLIDKLSGLKQINAPTLLAAIRQFSEVAKEPKHSSCAVNLLNYCEQVVNAIDFFDFATSLDVSKKDVDEDLASLHVILQVSERECGRFLEFLKHTQQISGPRRDAKVGFQTSNSGLSGFLKNLDLIGSFPLKLKSNLSDEGVKNFGEPLFSRLEQNTAAIDDWIAKALKCGIEPMILAKALITHKLRKQPSSIESNMRSFVIILKALSSLAEVPVTSADFSTESLWWKELREMVFNSRNVLTALPVAVCCRAVTIMLEKERQVMASPSVEATEEAILQDWENISADAWEWDRLISQLEDTALLNAVLYIKHSSKLPPPSYGVIPCDLVALSSQDFVKGGDGAVSEVVARWLCQFELPPENLIVKTDIEFVPIQLNQEASKQRRTKKEDEPLLLPLIEVSGEADPPSEYNEKILGNLKILKSRFRYSLTSSVLLSNVSWELFSSWHKDIPNMELLCAALKYLQTIPSTHLRGSIASLAWSTYIKVVFEGVCRLVGKIGRLPTDQLCSRELSIPRTQVAPFLDCTTRLLSIMLDAYAERPHQPFPQSVVRDSSSLIAVALGQPVLNEDAVVLHHQASTAIHLVAALDIRYPRLLAALFDSLKAELFGSLTKRRDVPLHHPGLNPARLQFLKRAVSASVQTVGQVEGESGRTEFSTEVATERLRQCFALASAWRLPLDDLRRQHVCELYSCGFDRLAEEVLPAVSETSALASQLLVVVGQRVKALLKDTQNFTELVANLNPALTAWLDSLEGESLIETDWNVKDCTLLMTRILQWLPNDDVDFHLATLLADSLPGLEHYENTLTMDPLYKALSFYRKRQFEKCAESCSVILDKNPYDEAVWVLKMRALTEQVYVDDIEDEEGIADTLLDTEVMASVPRPGTSLRVVTAGPRPVTGVVRPETSRPMTVEQALKTPRTAKTARPITAASGRRVRLGTASMLTEPDGPFIETSRLNLPQYAKGKAAKSLFEYLYYHEHDIQRALELCVEATQVCKFQDWWWKLQLGKCYFSLGLVRDAEQQFRSALGQHVSVELCLRLCRVHQRLDQPLAAIEVINRGLEIFPLEVTLLTHIARLYEALNNITISANYYREVIKQDAMNVEAIACVAVQYFHTDQPEWALNLYKRLLQMGVVNAALLNNLALCCFYAQQFNVALAVFRRALAIAEGEDLANVWYNIAHVAISVGDVKLASNCLRLCIAADGNHAAAYNDLGVLEVRRGRTAHARAFFQTSARLASYLFEPNFNHAMLAYECGDLQTSYIVVQKALEAYPTHVNSVNLLKELKKHFTSI